MCTDKTWIVTPGDVGYGYKYQFANQAGPLQLIIVTFKFASCYSGDTWYLLSILFVVERLMCSTITYCLQNQY